MQTPPVPTVKYVVCDRNGAVVGPYLVGPGGYEEQVVGP